jgi:hypothetical protein
MGAQPRLGLVEQLLADRLGARHHRAYRRVPMKLPDVRLASGADLVPRPQQRVELGLELGRRDCGGGSSRRLAVLVHDLGSRQHEEQEAERGGT